MIAKGIDTATHAMPSAKCENSEAPRCVNTYSPWGEAQENEMSEWHPIETAPKDGTTILLGNEHGCWVAMYQPVYQSGYRPDNPWFSMMLNQEYRRKDGILQWAPPTHWMPLPAPPSGAN